MKKIKVVILSLILVNVLMMSLDAYFSEALAGCPSSPENVRITVTEDAEKPIYEFNVTHHDKFGYQIYVVTIGVGKHNDPWNKGNDVAPIEVISPEGWVGRYVYAGENMGAMYVWSVKRDTIKHKFIGKGISSGETLSGFKLVMDKPLDIFMDLPFNVSYRSTIGCSYGKVFAKE